MMKCKKGEMYNIFQKIEILFKQNIKGNLQSKKEKAKKKQKKAKSKKQKAKSKNGIQQENEGIHSLDEFCMGK